MRPFETPHKILMSKSPAIDAWYGARDLANSAQLSTVLTTKQDYDENGGEYFREHFASNQYFATPAPTVELIE